VRSARFAAAAAIPAALLGCQTYTALPLDAEAHRAAWLGRSPSDEGVAAFARRLAAETGGGEAFDVADGLTLREAEAVALFFNPDLRLARLRADAALAGAGHAGRWEDPELRIDAERIIESVPEPWTLGASLGVTLPISGRLAVETSRAEASRRAELHRVAAEEWAVRSALRAAWLEWSAQRLRTELARGLLGRLDAAVEVTDRLGEAGELSRMESRLFRVERAARGDELRAAGARERELEHELRALMGLAPGAPVALVPAPVAAVGTTASADTATALGRRNPTLAVLAAEYDVAEQTLRREVREQYPDLTLGPGLATEEGDDRVGLGLSLPLPIWNRNRRAIAEARAERELARAAFETGAERLLARLAAAEIRLGAARARREAFEMEIVPMVEEQDADARRVAGLGGVGTLLTLENLTRLHGTKAALIDARLAEALAAATVAELVGPPPAETAPGRASP